MCIRDRYRNNKFDVSRLRNYIYFHFHGCCIGLYTIAYPEAHRTNNPNPDKLATYECGEESEGSAWVQFNIRFYVVALIFLIFDVEVVFLFPWAVVFNDLGLLAFVEMAIFLIILLIGLAYVWKRSDPVSYTHLTLPTTPYV